MTNKRLLFSRAVSGVVAGPTLAAVGHTNDSVTPDPDNPVVGGLDADKIFPGISPGKKYTGHVPTDVKSGAIWYYHCRCHGQAGAGESLSAGIAGAVQVIKPKP